MGRLGKARSPPPYAAAEGRVLREWLFQYVKGRSGRRPMLILRGQGGRVWEDGDCERFTHLSVLRLQRYEKNRVCQ